MAWREWIREGRGLLGAQNSLGNFQKRVTVTREHVTFGIWLQNDIMGPKKKNRKTVKPGFSPWPCSCPFLCGSGKSHPLFGKVAASLVRRSHWDKKIIVTKRQLCKVIENINASSCAWHTVRTNKLKHQFGAGEGLLQGQPGSCGWLRP